MRYLYRGSAGVYAFWFIDQRIYQRLLHSVFAYGLHTEFSNPDLPQLRSGMYIANLDVTNGLAWFYRTQFFVFLAISIIFLVGDEVVGTTSAASTWQAKAVAIALVIAHAILATIGEWRSRKWSTLTKMVEAIYPSLSAEMPVHERSTGPRTFDLKFLLSSERPPADNNERKKRWLARVNQPPVPLKIEKPPPPRRPRWR